MDETNQEEIRPFLVQRKDRDDDEWKIYFVQEGSEKGNQEITEIEEERKEMMVHI
jgi:hypothetical protein